MKIQSVRGMNDIGGDESHLWRFIEARVRKTFESYGFHEVRTPVLESTKLFQRGLGENTDAVAKEMYTFEDRSGDSLSLRPEGTASVVRAAIQHSWLRENPVLKTYYFGPMFRHERPQKGRYRQFFQFGAELFGPAGALADIEIILLQNDILCGLGLQDVRLHLTSLGCEVCRPPYREKLVAFLLTKESEFCEDCQRRIHTNPLRVLDCKKEKCKELVSDAPVMVDHLCGDCHGHFNQVRDALVAAEIEFVLDPKIVRGLDYYNRTAFEFIDYSGGLGTQATVSGGGRYDTLVENLGGAATPAVGFAAGVERIALLLQERTESLIPYVDVYFVLPDSSGLNIALKQAQKLRQKGLRVEVDLQQKSMKAQMKRANKLRSRFCVILGASEVDNNCAILRDMTAQDQEEIPLMNFYQEISKRIPKSTNFKL